MNIHVPSGTTPVEISIEDLQLFDPLFLNKKNLPEHICEFAKSQRSWSYEHMTKKMFEVMFGRPSGRKIFKKHKNKFGDEMPAFLIIDAYREKDTEGIIDEISQRMVHIRTCYPHEFTTDELEGVKEGKYYMIPDFSSENSRMIALFSISDIEFFTAEIVQKVEDLTCLNQEEYYNLMNGLR